MGVEGLYSFVLVVTLTGMITGIGVLLFDKVQTNAAATATSNTTFAAVQSAVGGVATSWLSLVVTIAVLSIVLGLVIAGFSSYDRQ